MESRTQILLVEDSLTQAIGLSHVLESAGWNVIHADSAERALETLGQVVPDLILIDYYLPGVRGDELCRQVRQRLGLRLTPIVILTGDAAQQLEVTGLESGADDFLSKSVATEVMLLRLRALLAKSRSTRPPAAPPPEPVFEGARILAVDDSPTCLAFLTAELASESYRIETVTRGAAALTKLETEEFDCLLVDLVMPEMDGIEVCRQVANWRSQSGLSTMVLMLTGKEDSESLARALDAGADDYVGKSSDIVVVKGRIRALLRRKFYEEEHRRRLSAELRAREIESRHAQMQRKAAEARAALADDLQRTADALRCSNEELQRFAIVASHDLQEPLRAITSYTQLIERRCGAALDDQARELFRFVVAGAARMKALIDGLLSYSRLQAAESYFERVSMSDVVAEALDNLKAAVDESAAEITCADLPIVEGDRLQLVQLVQNLLGNAIKYRGPRPLLVQISALQTGANWTISVRDNGRGIDPAYAERVFIIFQRLPRDKTDVGTGIGLAIAKRIVEQHRGRIWVESRENEGATFRFTLHAPQDFPAGGEPAAASRADHSPLVTENCTA